MTNVAHNEQQEDRVTLVLINYYLEFSSTSLRDSECLLPKHRYYVFTMTKHLTCSFLPLLFFPFSSLISFKSLSFRSFCVIPFMMYPNQLAWRSLFFHLNDRLIIRNNQPSLISREGFTN